MTSEQTASLCEDDFEVICPDDGGLFHLYSMIFSFHDLRKFPEKPEDSFDIHSMPISTPTIVDDNTISIMNTMMPKDFNQEENCESCL